MLATSVPPVLSPQNGAPAIHGGTASMLKPSPSVPSYHNMTRSAPKIPMSHFPVVRFVSHGTFSTYFTVYYGFHSWVAFSLPFLVFLRFLSKNEHRYWEYSLLNNLAKLTPTAALC